MSEQAAVSFKIEREDGSVAVIPARFDMDELNAAEQSFLLSRPSEEMAIAGVYLLARREVPDLDYEMFGKAIADAARDPDLVEVIGEDEDDVT